MHASHLSEVTRVELVHQDPVVVLATGVTASTRVAAMATTATVTSGHLATLAAVLRETGRLHREGKQGGVQG